MTNSAEHLSVPARGVQQSRQPSDLPAGEHRTTEKAPLRLATPARTKPVRRSVDLSPTCHVRLTQWCAETADVIGTARVTGQDVIRALVARLLVDERLAHRIRADLSINI
ncbi:MAG TPA: hypothetical protein VIY28_15310 [Pseudonocardiaceae bacterium]